MSIESISLKLRCAQTFLFRAKCKFCQSGPQYMYFIMNRYIDEKNFSSMRKYYTDNTQSSLMLADSFYMASSIKERRFRPSYMFDANTTYFKKLVPPNSKYQPEKDRFISILECECGETAWAFVDSRREHIKNRKNNRLTPARDIKTMYKIVI